MSQILSRVSQKRAGHAPTFSNTSKGTNSFHGGFWGTVGALFLWSTRTCHKAPPWMNMCHQQRVSSRRRRRPAAGAAQASPSKPVFFHVDDNQSSSSCQKGSLHDHQEEHSSTTATKTTSTPRLGVLDDILRSEKRQDDGAAPEASSLDEESSSSESHVTDFTASDDVPEAAPASLSSIDELAPQLCSTCDACPHCADVCADPFCRDCSAKKKAQHVVSSTTCNNDDDIPTYTPCQVRRHNHEASAWLVCGTDIYDATPFIERHPGGMNSMLRRAGGAADCTEDMKMHSRGAVRMWKGSRIGTLCACPGKGGIDARSNKNNDKKFECVIS